MTKTDDLSSMLPKNLFFLSRSSFPFSLVLYFVFAFNNNEKITSTFMYLVYYCLVGGDWPFLLLSSLFLSLSSLFLSLSSLFLSLFLSLNFPDWKAKKIRCESEERTSTFVSWILILVWRVEVGEKDERGERVKRERGERVKRMRERERERRKEDMTWLRDYKKLSI